MYTAHAPKMYNIIRMFKDAPTIIVKRNVTLEEAQAHCHNPETHSNTCTTEEGRALTAQYGMWFDGYDEADRY